ncbi:MAG: hypothetical protein A2579_02680 [Lysobacterales bacterium RIFOXYD1_FULL_69_11]|nr:MAG: hypothetical protein A2579_02680 [Xanthomonadales bacterium RIFOXYD1_FULL_69_11]
MRPTPLPPPSGAARRLHADEVPASRLQLPAGAFDTLLDGLCARFPNVSRPVWLDRFARGRVQDALGVPLDAAMAYRVGLEVRYFREVDDEPAVPFEERIVHADAHLVVADKPHFLPVTPAGGHVRETLLARLVRQLGNPDLVPLHRIDRDTAGLVMFSACADTRGRYQSLFAQRRIVKVYEAVAPPIAGVAMPHIHRSRMDRGEPFFRMREVDGVANSETRIDVIERGAFHWRYRLEPVTGRKHQLRVHMAALGAPIVGDSSYPAIVPRAAGDFSAPLQLLARSLSFVDPLSGEARTFESQRSLLSITPDGKPAAAREERRRSRPGVIEAANRHSRRSYESMAPRCRVRSNIGAGKRLRNTSALEARGSAAGESGVSRRCPDLPSARDGRS